MTDYYKGIFVTFEKDIHEDDLNKITDAIRMIKGVQRINKYVKDFEDHMSEEKGKNDAFDAIIKFAIEKRKSGY